MNFQKPLKSLGVLGVVIFFTSIIDLIFYWPATDYELFFMAKKVLFLFAGAFIAWEHLIKEHLSLKE
ncbi:hypothetical protein [Paraglaciecola sp.]|uniref:hypothetical protein n=1 Tax=Paraglaciecola sp. TaxID=1920173 RepID=UPI003263C77C